MKQLIIPYYANVAQGVLNQRGVEIVSVDGAAMAHICNCDEELAHEMSHPCRFDAVVILCCIEGAVKFSSQMSNYTIKAGEVFVDAVSVMQFTNLANSEFYMLVFKSDFLANMNIDIRFMANMLSAMRTCSHTFVLDSEKVLGVSRMFGVLKEEYGNRRNNYLEWSLRHLFCSMIYRIYNSIYESNGEVHSYACSIKDRSTEYFERLMRLIAEYYREQRNVEFYANKMNISSKHLSRVIRNFTGKSVHQWIDEFVVLEIKNLLKYSDLSIQQISYTLNFPNPSFMGQYFKRITGMTPGEYKRS